MGELRRIARRHGRLSVQELHPDAAVHEVCRGVRQEQGQFYTPDEVSRIKAKIIGISADTKADDTIYDPTCGSGSLLIRAADEATGGVSIYGQDGMCGEYDRRNSVMFRV